MGIYIEVGAWRVRGPGTGSSGSSRHLSIRKIIFGLGGAELGPWWAEFGFIQKYVYICFITEYIRL